MDIKEKLMKRTHIALIVLALTSPIAFAGGSGDHEHSKQDSHTTAIGKPGNPAKVSRTIEVDMNDTMRFTPSHVQVRRGETIKFIVKNNGKIKHEMVLGSAKELKAHAELMRKFPEMEHADPNQVSVDPGKPGP